MARFNGLLIAVLEGKMRISHLNKEEEVIEVIETRHALLHCPLQRCPLIANNFPSSQISKPPRFILVTVVGVPSM